MEWTPLAWNDRCVALAGVDLARAVGPAEATPLKPISAVPNAVSVAAAVRSLRPRGRAVPDECTSWTPLFSCCVGEAVVSCADAVWVVTIANRGAIKSMYVAWKRAAWRGGAWHGEVRQGFNYNLVKM